MTNKKIVSVLISIIIVSCSLGVLWIYEYKCSTKTGFHYYIQLNQRNLTTGITLNENYTVWLPIPEYNGRPYEGLLDSIQIRYGNCTIAIEKINEDYALKVMSSGLIWFNTDMNLYNESNGIDGLTMKNGINETRCISSRNNTTCPIYLDSGFFFWDDTYYTNIFGNQHKHRSESDAYGYGSLFDGPKKIYWGMPISKHL